MSQEKCGNGYTKPVMTRDDSPPMNIAEALVNQRQARGDISQEEAAELIGTSKQTISRWERGTQPGPEWVPDLARFLKLPTDRVRQLRRQAGPEARLDRIEARLRDLEEMVSQLVEARPRRGRPGNGR